MDYNSILESARKEAVKYIRLMFTDINGMVKNVEIPGDMLEEALNNEVMFDGSSIDGFARIDEADMYLCPDLNTWLILPWENTAYGKVARLICDVYTLERKAFEGDSRSQLKKQLKALKPLGFNGLNIGVEPEFFLFKLDRDENVTTAFNDNGVYFDLAPVDGVEDCLRDIVLELEKPGFKMEALHHEVAPGQHEINFRFNDALEACDQLQTFKLVVNNGIVRKDITCMQPLCLNSYPLLMGLGCIPIFLSQT